MHEHRRADLALAALSISTFTFVTTEILGITGALTLLTYVTPFLLDVTGFAAATLGPLLLVSGLAGFFGTVAVGRILDGHPWLAAQRKYRKPRRRYDLSPAPPPQRPGRPGRRLTPRSWRDRGSVANMTAAKVPFTTSNPHGRGFLERIKEEIQAPWNEWICPVGSPTFAG